MGIFQATPWGRMMGNTVREHPVVVLHGASSPMFPSTLGPIFARCRADPQAQGARLYLYDSKDELFARIERQQNTIEGFSHYNLLQPGDRSRQLDFKGNFEAHSVAVTDGNGKQVAHCE